MSWKLQKLFCVIYIPFLRCHYEWGKAVRLSAELPPCNASAIIQLTLKKDVQVRWELQLSIGTISIQQELCLIANAGLL